MPSTPTLNVISPLAYATAGAGFSQGDITYRGSLVSDLKGGRSRGHQRLLDQMLLSNPDAINRLFDRGVLVPVPGSAPLREGSVDATGALASALAAPFNARVVSLVERHQAVPKSSLAGSKLERPSVLQHYETTRVVLPSLEEDGLIRKAGRLILVDDVITMGRTMYACAFRLRQQFPELTIVGFAAFWTPFGNQTAQQLYAPKIWSVSVHPKGGPQNGETKRELVDIDFGTAAVEGICG